MVCISAAKTSVEAYWFPLNPALSMVEVTVLLAVQKLFMLVVNRSTEETIRASGDSGWSLSILDCKNNLYAKVRVSHTSLILTTETVFQAISPGVETLGMLIPSTQSLPHSTGQPLTKGGVFHQPDVGCVVTSAVQLGRGQILSSASSHLTKI